jgi:hypothetical protein
LHGDKYLEKGGNLSMVEEQTEEMRLIPTSLAQELVNYLGGKPYKEVYALVPRLMQLPVAPVTEKPDVEIADMES